jgi:hypothetical protein
MLQPPNNGRPFLALSDQSEQSEQTEQKPKAQIKRGVNSRITEILLFASRPFSSQAPSTGLGHLSVF